MDVGLGRERLIRRGEKAAGGGTGAGMACRHQPEPHRRCRDDSTTKKSWGISVSSLALRAHRLGYIDDRTYRSLQIQMSRWRKNEPAEFPPVPGQLLPRLVEINGGIRVCADRLGVNDSHLREVAGWHRLRAL